MAEQSKTRNVISGLARVIGIGILCYAAVFNPITFYIVGGMNSDLERKAKSRKFGYENHFRDACPDYFAASTWDQWFGVGVANYGWCEEFRDRM